MGAFWFLLTQLVFTPLLYPLGRRLWLHDLTHVDGYLARMEEMTWQAEDKVKVRSQDKRAGDKKKDK